jgi:hypothetical protein
VFVKNSEYFEKSFAVKKPHLPSRKIGRFSIRIGRFFFEKPSGHTGSKGRGVERSEGPNKSSCGLRRPFSGTEALPTPSWQRRVNYWQAGVVVKRYGQLVLTL